MFFAVCTSNKIFSPTKEIWVRSDLNSSIKRAYYKDSRFLLTRPIWLEIVCPLIRIQSALRKVQKIVGIFFIEIFGILFDEGRILEGNIITFIGYRRIGY